MKDDRSRYWSNLLCNGLNWLVFLTGSAWQLLVIHFRCFSTRHSMENPYAHLQSTICPIDPFGQNSYPGLCIRQGGH